MSLRLAFEFHDYRPFLNDRFEQLKKSKRNFSLRYCARRLDSAHSYLPYVLNGKRKIGLTRISNFAELFCMSTEEREYFTLMVLRELVEDPGTVVYLDRLLSEIRDEHRADSNKMPKVSSVSRGPKLESTILRFADGNGTPALQIAHGDVERLFEFVSMFTTDPHAILRVDRDTAFVKVSNSITSLFGYDPAEFVKESVRDFIHPDDQSRLSQMYLNSHFSFEATSTTLRHKTKSGAFIWVESRSIPVRDLEGELAYFIVAWRKLPAGDASADDD